MSILNNFQKVSTFWRCHGGEAEVIEDEDFGFCLLVHKLGIGAVGLGYGEFLKETRDSDVKSGVTASAGPVCQCASQVSFPTPRRTGDDDIL